ncbi:hypothetical protein LLH00_07415 [bacterium]|nr:hypothetical protein [bacterium]
MHRDMQGVRSTAPPAFLPPVQDSIATTGRQIIIFLAEISSSLYFYSSAKTHCLIFKESGSE